MGQAKPERRGRIDALSSSLCGVGIATMGLAGCVLLFGSVPMGGASGAAVVVFLLSCVSLAICGLMVWTAGEALWMLWEIREQLVREPAELVEPADHPAAQPAPPPAPAAEPQIPAPHSPPTSCPSCGYRISLPKGVAVRPGQTGTCPVCKTKITL